MASDQNDGAKSLKQLKQLKQLDANWWKSGRLEVSEFVNLMIFERLNLCE